MKGRWWSGKSWVVWDFTVDRHIYSCLCQKTCMYKSMFKYFFSFDTFLRNTLTRPSWLGKSLVESSMSLPESKYSVRFAWVIQPGANARPKLNQVISCLGKHLWPNCWTTHWSNCSLIRPTQPLNLVFGLTFLSWSLNGSDAGRAHILITPRVNLTSARPFYCYKKLAQTYHLLGLKVLGDQPMVLER